MAQRQPRNASSSNLHDRAPRTRHAQQFPWCYTRDTPDDSLPLRSTAQRRTRDAPNAACCCVQTMSALRIACTCHDFATSNTRTRARARNSHRATKSSNFRCCARFPAPVTQNDAQRGHRSHHSPRLPRETHAACTLPHASTRIHLRDTSGGHLAPHLPRKTHVYQRPNACSPHLPRGPSRAFPGGHASEVLRLPRATHVTARKMRARHTSNPIPTA